MNALPFSKKIAGLTPCIRFYLASNEAWQRAKREVKLGCDVLPLPQGSRIEDFNYLVEGRDVFILDLDNSQENLARKLGIHLIKVKARAVVYFGSTTIFFRAVNDHPTPATQPKEQVYG